MNQRRINFKQIRKDEMAALDFALDLHLSFASLPVGRDFDIWI